jgi:cathepsin X
MALLFLVSRFFIATAVIGLTGAFESELWDDSDLAIEDHYHSPLPISYIDPKELPDSFSWGDVNGSSYLTRSLNQHIPQYCGSCWAHASMSSLGDRIKIARKGQGDDVNLSIQYILNCGQAAGSCHGGSMKRTFQFIQENGFVPYDTCQPYLACSSESTEGFCPQVDTTCSAMNTCRTCMHNLTCTEIDIFPNATVSEFGTYRHDVEAVKAEIFARGPVATGVSGSSLSDYTGGIFSDLDAPRHTTHAVSIVGWGASITGEQFWIVRNSWGQYWGEMGYFRILMGQNVLGIEAEVTWATPGSFTTINFPCAEDGNNCGPSTQRFTDPSSDLLSIQHRLQEYFQNNDKSQPQQSV